MTTPPVLFHVGYHKTGTTWLQRSLFRPDSGYQPLMDHVSVFNRITKPHALVFDPNPTRDFLQACIKDNGLVPVVSSEILSGQPFWGARESAEFARRIHDIAPNARILLTIRAQIPIISSIYMQYLRRAGSLPARRFFAEDRIPGYEVFDPVHYEYHRLVGLYRTLFGADNVCVLTQELLASDPARFVADLAQFSGLRTPHAMPSLARVSVSESQSSVWLLRRINYFRRDAAGPNPIVDCGIFAHYAYRYVSWLFRRPTVKRLTAGARPVTELVQELFADRFAVSNRALKRMYGSLDLSDYEM